MAGKPGARASNDPQTVCHWFAESPCIAGNPQASHFGVPRRNHAICRAFLDLRKLSFCLPCRRSWVRVPSAALPGPRSTSGFFRALRSLVRLILSGTLDSEWTVIRFGRQTHAQNRRLCRDFAATRTNDCLRPRQKLRRLAASPELRSRVTSASARVRKDPIDARNSS